MTTEPTAVYSEDNLPANYLVGHMPQVTLDTKCDWQGGSLEIQIDSRRDQAEIVAFVPSISACVPHPGFAASSAIAAAHASACFALSTSSASWE